MEADAQKRLAGHVITGAAGIVRIIEQYQKAGLPIDIQSVRTLSARLTRVADAMESFREAMVKAGPIIAEAGKAIEALDVEPDDEDTDAE